jgi:hypothetical protein
MTFKTREDYEKKQKTKNPYEEIEDLKKDDVKGKRKEKKKNKDYIRKYGDDDWN